MQIEVLYKPTWAVILTDVFISFGENHNFKNIFTWADHLYMCRYQFLKIADSSSMLVIDGSTYTEPSLNM